MRPRGRHPEPYGAAVAAPCRRRHPVSFTDDYKSAAGALHEIGAQAPEGVAYFAEGLGGDLDRLVTALDSGQTGTAKAVGEVVTNRVRNLKSACQLIHDVETMIFGTLPDETWVYPGHGNDTTLGAERPQLPEWHARGW